MFIDTRELPDGSTIEKDVCIIGAGAAGISIALALGRRGIDVCVLESGGREPEGESLDLYRGENIGIPYTFADGSRSRYLGGSSNCWGGWCRPLDPWDFEPRKWVAHSGWPFGFPELAPYYEKAHPMLKLGPTNFELDDWVREVGRDDVRRFPLASDRIVDVLSQFSQPVRFGTHYYDELKASKHISVYLYANAVDLQTDQDARALQRVEIRTLTGRRAKAIARLFVLATGGIENPRLLLAANHKVTPNGLANGNDLVGRFFMDHPRLMTGGVKLAEGWTKNKLYDLKFHYLNPVVSAFGTCFSAQFALTPEVQTREELLNSRIWFASLLPGEGTLAVDALIRCKMRLTGQDQSGHKVSRDIFEILKNPIDCARFAATRVFHLGSLISDIKYQAIVEPEPNPDSRILLSRERDALGIPRAKVVWRLTERVKRTFDRTFQVLTEELERHGIATVRRQERFEGSEWPVTLVGTWHHMGTTRMHDSLRHGVVDRNCRVHGMSNFYIAGSSVFPTAGANYPTFTLVALALRLADHIELELKTPVAASTSSAGLAEAG